MENKKLPVIFLGVPVSTLSINETIDAILSMIDDYRRDLKPRYIATLNANFLSNAHSWNWGDIRNPELMHILRQAALVSIDGMPIVWCCRLMGTAVHERVTGIDLLPLLAEALGKKKLSMFLLGGTEKALKLCKLYLQALYSDLVIAGTANPKIDIEGENLESSEERDAALIEQINLSKPDILMINLGNPKQEIWFERVKNKLHVPISVGVGGSFDMLTGLIPRAPVWMQKSGLEWLYRVTQEPKRLWKRYLLDLFKFAYMTAPLLVFHNLNRLVYHIFYNTNGVIKLRKSLLFISSSQTLAVLILPKRLNDLVTREVNDNLDDLLTHDALILDFQQVIHIDLEGAALLLHICQRALKDKKQFFCLNLSGDVRLLLRLHRIWDLLGQFVSQSAHDISIRLMDCGKSSLFYYSIQQERQYAVISFFGKLDNTQDYDEFYKKIAPVIYQKECILDFSYCTYIDNKGFGFLLKLKSSQPKNFISLKITGLDSSIQRQFSIANLLHLFDRIPNLDQIFQSLHTSYT